jgi:hypothetical protein
MNELLDKIFKLLDRKTADRSYKFNFSVYTGAITERNNQIKVSNSIEYEFINAGTTIVTINDVLTLYPTFAGIGISHWKGTINDNEIDETIYKYTFREITATDFVGGFITHITAVETSYINTASPSIDNTGVTQPTVKVNKLIVITKEKSTVNQR